MNPRTFIAAAYRAWQRATGAFWRDVCADDEVRDWFLRRGDELADHGLVLGPWQPLDLGVCPYDLREPVCPPPAPASHYVVSDVCAARFTLQ